MRFFKRPAASDPSNAIEAFWQWWATDGDRAKRVVSAWAAGEPGLSPRIDVRPDPGWEVRRELGK